MAPPRGPRGEKVTVVSWTEEDGTQFVQVFAAAGTRPTKHESAEDFRKELVAGGVDNTLINVQTMQVR